MALQGISFVGINTVASIMNGNGLGDYGLQAGSRISANSFYAKILAMYDAVKDVSGVATDDASFNPLTMCDPAVNDTLQTLGNNREFGSGAFTTVVPGPVTSTIGTGHLHNRLGVHTSRLFGTNSLFCVQAIQNTIGHVQNSRDLHTVVDQAKNTFFGADPAGNDVSLYDASKYFLGATVNNPVDMVLNGYNSIVHTNTSLSTVAADFSALGKAYSMESVTTFGNPGQLVQAINNEGIASVVQLDIALINQGLAQVAISDLDDPVYNDQCSAALENIVNKEAVRVVKSMLGVTNTQIQTMKDLLTFEVLFPNHSLLKATTIQELQIDLEKLELGAVKDSGEFGTLLASLLLPTMPSRGNEGRPVTDNARNTIQSHYSYQGRALNLADFFGSVSGYTLRTPVNNYIAALDVLDTAGDLTALKDAADEVTAATTATYTSPNTKTGGINVKLDLFTAELVSLIAKENINNNITTAITAYETIANTLANEKTLENRFNLYLNDRMDDKNFAVGFTGLLQTITTNSEDKDMMLAFATTAIENGDSHGEYLSAYISEINNITVVDNKQVRYLGGVQR
jgi:hypothetical protein